MDSSADICSNWMSKLCLNADLIGIESRRAIIKCQRSACVVRSFVRSFVRFLISRAIEQVFDYHSPATTTMKLIFKDIQKRVLMCACMFSLFKSLCRSLQRIIEKNCRFRLINARKKKRREEEEKMFEIERDRAKSPPKLRTVSKSTHEEIRVAFRHSLSSSSWSIDNA